VNQKFDEDSCAGYSDVLDCADDRGDRFTRSKPCPSPVPSDDCFDPCPKSSPRRGGRSPRDDRCGSGRGSRSGRKPTRSASEICDECSSMNATPNSPFGRRRRDNSCDDIPCCPPRNPCAELRQDRAQAPFKRGTNFDGGSERGSHSRSPSRGRSTSERRERSSSQRRDQRSGRTTPASRSQSRPRSSASRGDECSQDGRDEGSLERTTTRTRSGGPCCPNPEERDCETESRFLLLITSARKVMFLLLSVCLFVCLSDCHQHYSECYRRIFL